MFSIEFEPVGCRSEFPPGLTLLDCARALGVGLISLCAGEGTCGRCVVKVVRGRVSAVTAAEAALLTPQQLAGGYRLACQTIPLSDCCLFVPPESLSTPQRLLLEGTEITVPLDPPVRLYTVTVLPPSLDDLRAYDRRLLEALQQQHGLAIPCIDPGLLRDLVPHLCASGHTVQVAVRSGEAIAVLPMGAQPLGLAVDLGTTKIALYLVDMLTGRTLASMGIMNPQIAYGEDVISRLAYGIGGPSQATHLQRLVTEALNQALADLCAQVQAKPAQVVEMVVVGNTAMHHLFLGLPVEQLGHAPYVAAAQEPIDIKARDLGLNLATGAYVHLLPIVAGFVGADHVAVLLATGADTADGAVLIIDIGTNTEICLANRGMLTSLSCASGPAFEGAHIRYGMRAATGAIEHLRLVGERVEYQTIGGGRPAGLCGSAVLDAIAQLYLAGVLTTNGRISRHPRVRETSAGREFVLVDETEAIGHAITITQKDVRQVQLAKGAICTGIRVLLEKNGLKATAIERVIIAGAFGTYIDINNAVAIGLLPDLPLERFQQVGNAAGTGARMALLSQRKRAEAQAIARRIGYIELATMPGFADIFAQAMALGRWS